MKPARNILTLWSVLLLLLASPPVIAQPSVLYTSLSIVTPASFNNRWTLNDRGAFRQFRFQANQSGNFSWAFHLGAPAAPDYSICWRPYTSGNVMSYNTFIPAGWDNGAHYNTSSGGADGEINNIRNGYFYTFNVQENSASDNAMAVLETDFDPKTISLSDAPAPYGGRIATVTLSAPPEPGEYVYVRYTTDNYANSTVIPVTFTGNTGTVTLPVPTFYPATQKFYAYSSNKTKAEIDAEVADHSSQLPHDMLALEISNGFQNDFNNQVVVTSTGGATLMNTYATLKAVFDAVNAGVNHTGTITVALIGNTTETATAVLNAGDVLPASWSSVGIQPAGGAARTVSGSVAGNALVHLSGADHVTVNGLNSGGNTLTVSNTSTSSSSLTSTIRFSGDATDNTLTNCTVLGSASMTLANNGGTVYLGSASSTGNDNISISNCMIGPAGASLPSRGIYSYGNTASAGVANSGITVSNCEIYDFFLTTGCAGIYADAGNTDWSITGNKIYQTSARTFTAQGTMTGIYFSNSAYGNNLQVTGNTIGYASAAGSGTLTLLGSTFAGAVQGIYIHLSSQATDASNISSNVVSDISLASSIGYFYGIYNNTAANSNTVHIDNNSIRNIATTTTTGDMFGIYSGSANTLSANGNTINNLSRTGSGDLYGIKILSPANANFNQNTISNLALNNSSSVKAVYGICGINSAVNVTVNENAIFDLSTTSNTTSGIAYVIGIRESGGNGNKVIRDNSVYDLSAAGGYATVRGIYTSASSGTHDIGTNLIHTLTGGQTLNGICQEAGTSATIYNNKIYDIATAYTGVSGPWVYGIYLYSGTLNTVYNNFIGDLRTTAANTAIPLAGIYAYGGTTNNIFYNTVYLNATSSGALFGSAALLAETGTTLNLRNNILVNTSTPKGSGITAAYCRTSTSLAAYAVTSDNNLFYAGSPSANHLILYDGTNSYQALAAYKTAVSPRDAVSISENPHWTSTTGADAAFLHVKTCIFTGIESGAANISSPFAITDDYDGNTRFGNPGYPGSSTTGPDIGADEFDPDPPTITLGANPSVCKGSLTASLPYTSTTGSPDHYSITWDAAAITAGFIHVTDTLLPVSPIAIAVPAGAPAASYKGTLSVSNQVAGCTSREYLIGIIILSNPVITLENIPPVCPGSISASLTYTATSGNPDHYSIDYSAAANAAGFTDVTNSLLPVSPILLVIPAAAPSAVYNGTLTVMNSVTGCLSAGYAFSMKIEDGTPPVARCKNISVQLYPDGQAIITPGMVDNGSTDDCSIASMTVNPSTLSCVNVTPLHLADLIISEYIEGTDNNKYIEIYNGTAMAVDLSAYAISTYPQGINPNTSHLSGILPAGFTIVYRNSQANIYTGSCAQLSSMTFNGNDAVVLHYYNAATATFGPFVDIFGVIGDNPGQEWTGPGGYTTRAATLRRKSTVYSGITVNPSGTGPGAFTTLATEWDLYPINEVSGLGSHLTEPVQNNVTLTVTDNSGNSSSCSSTIIVNDVTPPTVSCKDVVVQLDASGLASVSAGQVNNGSYDACGIETMIVSPFGFTCANLGANTVTLTVKDINGNSASCNATVTVQDLIVPVAVCRDISAYLDSTGSVTIIPDQVNNGSSDNCGIVSMTVSPNTFTCADVSATQPFSDLIISEYIEGSSNNKYIEIYNGTGANVDLSTYHLQLYSNGSSTPTRDILLSGTLNNGAVKVYKNSAATIYTGVASNNAAVDFNGNDAVALYKITTASYVDIFGRIGENPGAAWTSGSFATDNKTLVRKPAVMSGVTSNPVSGFPTLATEWFQYIQDDVSNLGLHTTLGGVITVTLTVNDAAGNSSSCNANVTVADQVPPTAICQNRTIQIDASGNASITAVQVDNGSFDACGILSLSVSPSTFTCANLGDNTVTLTVKDINGNQSICTAVVTVTDIIPPSAVCQDIVVNLGSSGIISILPSLVNNGSSDNCGTVSMTLSPASFTCNDVSNPPLFSDLIISEYVEGSGSNKYIEIYNGTGVAVNLSDYRLRLYTNGASTPTIDVALTGTLINKSTVVYKNSAASLYSGASTNNVAVNFNGDDAVVLYKVSSSANVDIFGNIGQDPGNAWTVGGLTTMDATLRRKNSVTGGVTFNPSSGFPTLAAEWDLYPTDVVSGLGAHSTVAGTATVLTVTDGSGNTSTCNANVIVQDNLPPVVTCPDSPPYLCRTGTYIHSGTAWNATATDNCGIASVSYELSGASPGNGTSLNGAVFNQGVTMVTWTAVDVNGNTSSCSFDVTVYPIPVTTPVTHN